MGNSPVDRSKNYMKEVWGTTSLTTDYWSLPKKRMIQRKSASRDHARRFKERAE